ncbi:MAG: phosphoribosylformylglycinamidine cyclo-ligase [Dehalococcoidia bacterium]
MNVNDILTRGARPLFFLDYVSFSDSDEHRMETLLRGMVWGCREVGCALIGGETAQMPGLYSGDDFDLAGFVVGVAEESEVLDGSSVEPGDVLLGFASSGLHTNGYSLVRRIFGSDENPSVLYRRYEELNHHLGEELLVRHRCYYPLLQPILGQVKGLSHITGGGLPGKMPPILPAAVAARFEPGSWQVPPIFSVIQREGNIATDEMRRVFNMGLGMVAVCAPDKVPAIQAQLPEAQVVGEIVDRRGDSQVVYG